MNAHCKHGHIDGAMHKPCYQCRSEAFADDITELERMNAELRARIAALEAERAEAVRAEREACALIADKHKSYWGRNIAAAIRSRNRGMETT